MCLFLFLLFSSFVVCLISYHFINHFICLLMTFFIATDPGWQASMICVGTTCVYRCMMSTHARTHAYIHAHTHARTLHNSCARVHMYTCVHPWTYAYASIHPITYRRCVCVCVCVCVRVSMSVYLSIIPYQRLVFTHRAYADLVYRTHHVRLCDTIATNVYVLVCWLSSNILAKS